MSLRLTLNECKHGAAGQHEQRQDVEDKRDAEHAVAEPDERVRVRRTVRGPGKNMSSATGT